MRNKSRISLKKEIANIVNSAEFLGNRKVRCDIYNTKEYISQTNMYVTEIVDEHGNKCIYHFEGGCKDMLLKRAASFRKETVYKFKDSENGTSTQKVIIFLKEHKEALQVLCDINSLMKAHDYGVQEACSILFKDKKHLPPNFGMERVNGRSQPAIYCFYMGRYFRSTKIEYLIDYILPILPKVYFDGLERD